MTASTRRAALGAILAAPLTSGAVVASPYKGVPLAHPSDLPPVSRKLARLIAKHDRIDAILKQESEGPGFIGEGLIRAAGAIRARVAGFPSASFADTLAKAACLARLWSLADAEQEIQTNVASGYVYMDCMALNIAVEVMKLGEGTLCA